jgi:hypothetical protein
MIMKQKSIWCTISASLTALALIAFPTCSVLAGDTEIPEFTQTGHYPNTVFVSITSATSGATIFYTRSLWPYSSPPYPTHSGTTPINCQVYYGPLGVGNGQYSFFFALAYHEGLDDSSETYEVDNRGL